MRIRDSHATLNGDATEHTMPSGSLDIIAEDGRTLFNIELRNDGTLRVDAGHRCKHLGVVFDDIIQVTPISSNAIRVSRRKPK